MKTLSNNKALEDYMLSLSSEFGKQGLMEWSKLLSGAVGRAAMSTELLGESRIVLRRILQEDRGLLPAQERSDMQDVVKQIDDVLNKKNVSSRK